MMKIVAGPQKKPKQVGQVKSKTIEKRQVGLAQKQTTQDQGQMKKIPSKASKGQVDQETMIQELSSKDQIIGVLKVQLQVEDLSTKNRGNKSSPYYSHHFIDHL